MHEVRPISDFQRAVLTLPENWNLALLGGRGGGKSNTAALLVLKHVEKYREKARALFLRQTYTGLVDFELMARELFGSAYGPGARYNGNDHVWRFPNSATFELGQLKGPEDYQKYQGRSFTLLIVDEAGQYPTPMDIDMVRSNIRAPVGVPLRIIVIANPGGPGHHWINGRHYEDRKPWQEYELDGATWITCPSTFRDNPFIDQDAYERQLDAATIHDPALGAAWKSGRWDNLRGSFFAGAYDAKRNVIEDWDPSRFNAASWPGKGCWDLYLAHDWGRAKPSVTLVLAKARIDRADGGDGKVYAKGSVIVLDELATCRPGDINSGIGWSVEQVAEDISAMSDRWHLRRPEGCADDACFAVNATHSVAKEFSMHGVYFRRAKKGNRLSGWERLRVLMTNADPDDTLEKSGLYITERCQYLRQTLPILGRDQRKPDDLDSNGPDHGADALRYGALYSVPRITSGHVIGAY
jgi:hypothetical protein